MVSTSPTTNYDIYEYLRVGNGIGPVHRSFLRFDTNAIEGKHVTAATLKPPRTRRSTAVRAGARPSDGPLHPGIPCVHNSGSTSKLVSPGLWTEIDSNFLRIRASFPTRPAITP
ncbi:MULTISPECIES: hypothetical protein [unclassified Frankia]